MGAVGFVARELELMRSQLKALEALRDEGAPGIAERIVDARRQVFWLESLLRRARDVCAVSE